MMDQTARKPVLGLTGGIGSGKSLVAGHLRGMGCAVIDADALAREALGRPSVREKLVRWWGPGILGPRGLPDRRKVAKIVFESPQELSRIEAVLHPLVHEARRALRRRFQADPSVRAIVEDCPLLLEKGLDSDCDVVIFVAAGEATRLRRLAASRQWSAEDLLRREKNQLPLDIKAERADYTIDNDAAEEDCSSHVRLVLSRVLKKFKA
jgi:dephospho-CoA kinase